LILRLGRPILDFLFVGDIDLGAISRFPMILRRPWFPQLAALVFLTLTGWLVYAIKPDGSPAAAAAEPANPAPGTGPQEDASRREAETLLDQCLDLFLLDWTRQRRQEVRHTLQSDPRRRTLADEAWNEAEEFWLRRGRSKNP